MAGFGKLLKDVFRTEIEDCMNGVETQGVDVIFGLASQYKALSMKKATQAVAVGAVEIDGIARGGTCP